MNESVKQEKLAEELRSIGQGEKDGIRRNRDAAIKLGVNGIVMMCPGCLCISQEYAAGDGMDYVFILDFDAKYFQRGKLSLAVDLYEGCHKSNSHSPSFDLDQQGTKTLLSKI
jgi:hypothetical protein